MAQVKASTKRAMLAQEPVHNGRPTGGGYVYLNFIFVSEKNKNDSNLPGRTSSVSTFFFAGKGFRALNLYTTGISCVETRNQQTSCWTSVVAVSYRRSLRQLACPKNKATLLGTPEYLASTSSREEGTQARGKKDAHARQRAALPPDDPNTYAMRGF